MAKNQVESGWLRIRVNAGDFDISEGIRNELSKMCQFSENICSFLNPNGIVKVNKYPS